jgi:hypothetical protein
MNTTSRNINSLENSIARYIYIKYIQERQQPDPDTSTHSINTIAIAADNRTYNEDEPASSDDSSSSENEHIDNPVDTQQASAPASAQASARKIRPKVLDKATYSLYRKNIFHQPRACFTLNQDDLIREDLQTMALADAAYETHPADFKLGNFALPPDVLRCSFIRKYHHRYYRCRKVIMNKDSDICKKHENNENIYYDQYNDFLEKMTIS